MSDHAVEALKKVHEVYASLSARWQFMYESYEGGLKYQQGEHLTKYANESTVKGARNYADRIATTPIENHCASVISVYNSFLFRKPIGRQLDSLAGPDFDEFIKDSDFDGRDINSFMKDVSTWASVYGHTWIVLAKANIGADSVAAELDDGVRPYANIISPLAMLDWRYTRSVSGKYDLSYIKYIDDKTAKLITYKEWTDDLIITSTVDRETNKVITVDEDDNDFGKIPAFIAYNKVSTIKGIGISDINDIADTQKAIYNMNSEIEQAIRLDAHPILCKPKGARMGNGAGAILHFPENMTQFEIPFFLETGNSNIQSMLDAKSALVESVDMMANTGAIRATETLELSGIAMQTEFELLNAKLAEKAANLALVEEQMFKCWADYQGKDYGNSTITYPDSFNIRDVSNEITQLSTAAGATDDPAVRKVIDDNLIDALGGKVDQTPGNS